MRKKLSLRSWINILLALIFIWTLSACGEESASTAIPLPTDTPTAPAVPIPTATPNLTPPQPSATPRPVNTTVPTVIQSVSTTQVQPTATQPVVVSSNGTYTIKVSISGFPSQITTKSIPYKDGIQLYEEGVSNVFGNLTLHVRSGEITHIKALFFTTAELTYPYPIDSILFLRQGDINLTKGSPLAIAVSSNLKEILIPNDDLRNLAEYFYQQDDKVEAKLKRGLRLLTPIKP